ncbi:hypothetical protein DH2020_019242 [Rehmannia glutinosa]|uniref:Protein kinase domain-containing protein n=1 Tax=Rehmannia glutinosa TaxID=99300 RepID=A0ABR0WQ97_REHGL
MNIVTLKSFTEMLKLQTSSLDEDFEVVVRDFGLAKLVDVRKTNVTTQVRGTMGHIAPEYLSTRKSSEKADVFGYGILLLEIVSQRAIDFSRLEEEDDVKKLQREKKLDAIVDRNLNRDYNIHEVEMMIVSRLLHSIIARKRKSDNVRIFGRRKGSRRGGRSGGDVEVTMRQEYERLREKIRLG